MRRNSAFWRKPKSSMQSNLRRCKRGFAAKPLGEPPAAFAVLAIFFLFVYATVCSLCFGRSAVSKRTAIQLLFGNCAIVSLDTSPTSAPSSQQVNLSASISLLFVSSKFSIFASTSLPCISEWKYSYSPRE